MTVLTIFNHGSGGASTKEGKDGKFISELGRNEIVNIFGRTFRSSGGKREYYDYMITEGVGGKEHPEAHHIGVPDMQWASRDRKYLEGLSDAELFPVSYFGKTKKKLANLKGLGVEENVSNVLNVISTLYRLGKMPTTINMMGWSRGAVTCIRIAYKLYKGWKDPHGIQRRFPQIACNIFAVDPVAGRAFGHWDHNSEIDARTVTPNVSNYVATLAEDECGSGFLPMTNSFSALQGTPSTGLIIEDAVNTKWCILPFPGVHSDLAKFTNASGALGFHLCYQFLTHNGTDTTGCEGFRMPNDECLDLYELLRTKPGGAPVSPRRRRGAVVAGMPGAPGAPGRRRRGAIAPGMGRGITDMYARGRRAKFEGTSRDNGGIWRGGTKARNVNRSDYVGVGSDFFVNAHHQGLFSNKWSVVYRTLFGAEGWRDRPEFRRKFANHFLTLPANLQTALSGYGDSMRLARNLDLSQRSLYCLRRNGLL